MNDSPGTFTNNTPNNCEPLATVNYCTDGPKG